MVGDRVCHMNLDVCREASNDLYFYHTPGPSYMHDDPCRALVRIGIRALECLHFAPRHGLWSVLCLHSLSFAYPHLFFGRMQVRTNHTTTGYVAYICGHLWKAAGHGSEVVPWDELGGYPRH
jgi:hypothetical protein